jgi:DNA invertase Pin-like site-specific DNA recombinase
MQVRDIFHAKGKVKDIARQFGITQSTVSVIKNRLSWTHLNLKDERITANG